MLYNNIHVHIHNIHAQLNYVRISLAQNYVKFNGDISQYSEI